MKILILGANGMIGHRVLLEANSQFGTEVYGATRRSLDVFLGNKAFGSNLVENIDVLDWASLENLLHSIRPDVIVNAVGLTLRREKISDLSYAMEINSLYPHKLSNWAAANKSRVIHFSTDCVFGGESGHYTELSLPTAKDNYGKTKFLGEITNNSSLTLRFSCIGQELDVKSELLEWFLAQKGKAIRGFTRAMYSGVTSLVVARETCRIISDFKDLTGLYQISSEPISKYDLLLLAKKHFNIDIKIEAFEGFISDKTLVSEKYSAKTGFKCQSWEAMMQELANDKRIEYKR